MRIVCSGCRKFLGVQKPFNDNSEIPAKCPDCLEKEKEEASKLPEFPLPGEQKDITLENGLKGFLAVADADSAKLSLWDLIVSGKKVLCAKDRRASFQKYLKKIDNEQVDVCSEYSFAVTA